jgi:transcriptional regulator
MYIPKHYNDKEHLLIKKLVIDDGFGSLISTSGGNLYSTLLPFAVDDIAKPTKLLAHMAKSNPQWEGLDGTEVMVQFVGPHAYISTSFRPMSRHGTMRRYRLVEEFMFTTIQRTHRQ